MHTVGITAMQQRTGRLWFACTALVLVPLYIMPRCQQFPAAINLGVCLLLTCSDAASRVDRDGHFLAQLNAILISPKGGLSTREAWRISIGLDSFVLLGHSIGGYLAVAYAERYPKRCLRLILASPVGVPEPPSGLSEWVASRPLFFRLAFALWRRGASPYTLANARLVAAVR